MKFKHVFATLGLASVMALGVGVALAHIGEMKAAKATGEQLYVEGTLNGVYSNCHTFDVWNEGASQYELKDQAMKADDAIHFTSDHAFGIRGYSDINEQYGNRWLWDSEATLNYITPKFAAKYSFYIKSDGTIYTNTSDCFVRGTVAGLSIADDCYKLGDWNGGSSQFEIINLHLTTDDVFYFFAFGKGMGYNEIKGNQSLWDNEDSSMSPKANGYYCFYIQNESIYTIKTETEEVDDGVYLLGEAPNNVPSASNKMVQSGAVYKMKRDFALNETIKAKKYVDGLGTWLEIDSVTSANESFYAEKFSTDVMVKVAGKYTLRVYLSSASAYTYAFTDEATEWAQTFNNNMVCHNGESAPTFINDYSWAKAEEDYDALGDIAKNYLKALEGKVDGNDCEVAVYKYDLIMAHGYTGFNAFIEDANGVERASVALMNQIAIIDKNNTMILIAVISCISILSVAGLFFIIRKRKHQ